MIIVVLLIITTIKSQSSSSSSSSSSSGDDTAASPSSPSILVVPFQRLLRYNTPLRLRKTQWLVIACLWMHEKKIKNFGELNTVQNSLQREIWNVFICIF